ncbi:hypothetical protein MMC06_006434 [Schaereria dolodes]|nr:hypothetical protein [Schaereria dolodes]
MASSGSEAHSVEDPEHDAPPHYNRYECDETFISYDEVERIRSAVRPPMCAVETVAPSPVLEITFDYPLSVTMDNEMIYPTLPPSTAMYHLPRALTFAGDHVYLRRNIPGGNREDGKMRRARSSPLYEIRRLKYTDDKELCLRCLSPPSHPYGDDRAHFKCKSGLFHGRACDVSRDNKVVLQCRRGKWKDEAGKIVATEGEVNDRTINVKMHNHEERKHYIHRILVIEDPVSEQLRDLIMAAWCSQVWLEKTDGSRGLATLGSAHFDKEQKRLTKEMMQTTPKKLAPLPVFYSKSNQKIL